MGEEGGENKAMCSMIEETSVVNKRPLDYLDTPQLPPPPLCHLPFDLVEEILCRLPVKILLQLRCVCKSWNSLISDPRFANKHLSISSTTTTCSRLYCLEHCSDIITIASCPLHSTVSTKVTYLKCPSNLLSKDSVDYFVQLFGSCNGILCIVQLPRVMVWNPSINKFKILPPFEKSSYRDIKYVSYGFGYDLATGNYKVVSVFDDSVKVNTLGTNFWKSIQNFPFDSIPDHTASGKFLNGKINWLASKDWWPNSPCFIVSLDLGTYSYQKILSPDRQELYPLSVSELEFLNVLRDCLCVTFGRDIWIMKEYGNKESWTKLYTVSYMRDPSKFHNFVTKALYIFEDDQVLIECRGDWGLKLVLYDPKINTFEFIKFEKNGSVYNLNYYIEPQIYLESLIWPC